ncbi:alpha/beta hydrolase family protein [Larkinella sp. GY13]|uniref:alpha/beta hydrolase family protein n=1 Tax=Larkinella sp. GY13 TaxID=3453720 RepID=UPI003EED4F14
MKKITVALMAFFLITGSVAQAQIDTTLRRVLIPNGDLVIDGLLILPKKQTVPAPAIIWVGGSGDWEMISNYSNEPDIFYRYYLEHQLLAKGYAILYMNKRGKGRSTGNWQKAGFEDRAIDANAAHRYLATLPGINPKQIGMVGHSQGGWIVQLAATQNPNVAFTVALCGPTVDVYTQTMQNYQRLYECEGLQGKSLTRKLKWKKRELALGNVLGRVFKGGEAGQWARIRHYSHDAALRKLLTPSLMVFGELDAYVWPQANLNHLRSVFPEGVPTHIQTYLLPHGEHMLHVVPNGCVLDWDELKDNTKHPYSEALRDYLTTWITAVTAKPTTAKQ